MHRPSRLLAKGLLSPFILGAAIGRVHAQPACPNAAVHCSEHSEADVAAPQKPPATTVGSSARKSETERLLVTAKRRQLLGAASTASEGVVDDQELQLTPAYRPGQLLETVPGLIVTLHSGEGKANQFLMRGYNLDHGTDLETYVDDMPVNQPTHAHGQGYTDLNFLIPELEDGLTYTKGPYYAGVGDFGSVGSVRVSLRDDIPDEMSVTAGTLGFERLFSAGSQAAGKGTLLEAVDLQHYDGPFDKPDDARKEDGVLRYSQGGDASGFSVTGMVYHQVWTNTTDIPLRAITDDVVPDRFGTLDPSDGGHALRASVSSEYHQDVGTGTVSVSAYYIYNQLHLFNDFTHYLIDPVHGDQEDQFENRNVLGAEASYTLPLVFAGLHNEFTVGAMIRDDMLIVGRLPSEGQVPLAITQAAADPASYFNKDRISLLAGAIYVQATTHWAPAIRTVLGLRDDTQYGMDFDEYAQLHEAAGYTNGGTRSQSLVQPKGSLIYDPIHAVELYVSAGEGFHSADLRGVNQDISVDLGLPRTPLLARQIGEEVGLRSQPYSNVTFTVALYNLWQQSETILDPDVGQDTAGPPSRRYGLEVNVTYQIRKWLEFYASFSANHTRFTQNFDDGTGHFGEYITDAPSDTGSAALYLVNFGPWSGGLDFRYLGNYPLSSGACVNSAAVHDFPGVATSCATAPTAQGQVNGKGFGQFNLDVRYKVSPGWTLGIGIYNLLNTNAAAAEFWYVDRLKSEIGTYPDGRADIHQHPLEPLMARFTLTKRF
jgi:outer membrane receptor protein involved in Fe transport